MKYDIVVFMQADQNEYISVKKVNNEEFDSSFDEMVFDYLGEVKNFLEQQSSIKDVYLSLLDKYDETLFQLSFEFEGNFPEDGLAKLNDTFFENNDDNIKKYCIVNACKNLSSKPDRVWMSLKELNLDEKFDFIG